ncbi:Hypothetical protein I595_1983 [Croceitalea dokdonensis DOKDO 023]|uniref:Uncharacterized protein n=1 Tax=Croceitalea dokdonensis DOKDO 023 TaxID=1300341 RepID=A0A0P7B0A4_9FLAO|nr:Hypothetical protein I595_1983 [Croceitalea dokdonensis DOKDO 023]
MNRGPTASVFFIGPRPESGRPYPSRDSTGTNLCLGSYFLEIIQPAIDTV